MWKEPGVNQMSQLAGVFAARFDMSLIPRTYMAEGELTLTNCPLTSTCVMWYGACPPTYMHIQINRQTDRQLINGLKIKMLKKEPSVHL